MLVAIHQPNFLPWLGWFDKLARADVLVLLDNVAMRRSGSSWVNRVQVLVQGHPTWLTIPVEAGSANRARIDGTRISDDGKWRSRMRRTIEHAYGRSACYGEVMPALTQMFASEPDSLCEFNLLGLRIVARLLGLEDRPMIRASTLAVSASSTDLLIEIVRAVGGDAYLAGGGASGYQEDEKFAAAGLRLQYQDFRHPEYAQGDAATFVPGLSIVDALMNCGPDSVARMLSVEAVGTKAI